MKKWRKELKRIGALLLAVMLMGTSTDFSVLAAENQVQLDTQSSEVLMTASSGDAVSSGNVISSGDIALLNDIITISNDGYTEVGDETALRGAVENGESIKLTADITLSASVTIAKSLTVDLNDHVITITGGDSAFYTESNSDAKVKFTDTGSLGTGAVYSESNAVHVGENTEAVIEGGKYTGSAAIYNDGTTVINGGSFHHNDSTGRTIANSAGTMTINGGEIYAGAWGAVCAGGSSVTTTIVNCRFMPHPTSDDYPYWGYVEYWGGTLVLGCTDMPAFSLSNQSSGEVTVGAVGDANAQIQIPAATHQITTETGNAVTALEVYDTNSVIYYFGKIPVQAMWGTSADDSNMTEGDLADALSAAATNSDIKYIKLGTNLSDAQYTIGGGVFTLDLNGKTVTGVDNQTVFNVTGSGTDVTFTDSASDTEGKVTAVGSLGDVAAILVQSGAAATIEKGTYAGGYAPLIVETEGKATVKGGTFDGAGSGTDSYYPVYNKGSLTVTGGTFKTFNTGTYAIRAYSGTTTLTGGSFIDKESGNSCFAVIYEGGTLDLSGVTTIGYRFMFQAVPGSGQLSIPEGYSWLKGDEIVAEINAQDSLTLKKAVKVSFDANGGSGVMDSEYTDMGEYGLPECEFTGPEGLSFLGWANTAEGNVIGNYYQLTGDTTFYAVWGIIYDVYVGGVPMEDGDYLASGADEVSKTVPASGGYAYYKDGVLTLNNYVYSGDGYIYYYYDEYDYYTGAVYCTLEELKVVLQGESALTNTLDYSDGMVMEKGTLVISGTGTLDISAAYGISSYSVYDEEADESVGGNVTIESGTVLINTEDAGIFAYGNVTVKEGTLEIISQYYTGIFASGNVVVNGGILRIATYDDRGIEIYGSVIINGGVLDISAYSDAIYAEGGITPDGEKVEILLPTSGTVSDDGCYIVDSNNNIASEVFILFKTEHTWSADYAYNAVAHWHTCQDSDCILLENSSLYRAVAGSGYEEHDTNGENGVCSACGYDTGKQVEIYVGDLGLAEGEYLDNSGRFSTTQPASGGYAYYKDGVLTLNNYVYEGEGYSYYYYDESEYYTSTIYPLEDTLKVELLGKNKLVNTYSYGSGIVLEGCNLTISGTGTLDIVAGYDGIEGYGIYDEETEEYVGGNVTIDGGVLNIDAYDDGIYSDGNVVVNGGTLNIKTEDDDGIDLNGDWEGNLIINDGTVIIHTDDKAIDIYGSAIINGGKLDITSDTDDGFDVDTDITVKGGIININVDDDGFRADYGMTIEGGIITIDAGDYGIWCDDDLTINGGVIIITSDLDDESGDVPVIIVSGEITLGDNVAIQAPEGGAIGTLTEEWEDESGVYEYYYDIIVDSEGEMVTYAVITEKLQMETAVTLKNNTLTYGEALSKLEFGGAKFVNNVGDTIEGTLAWKEPTAIPNAETTSATWVFTPSITAYDSVEGTVVIVVNKATPTVSAVPTVAERIYGPSAALADSALNGGSVKGVDGKVLIGTWSWQDEETVPVVNNNGYVAVFTPDDITNYEKVTGTVTVTVTPATPVITAASGAAITYGDILFTSTLSGAAQHSSQDSTVVPGTFAWKNVNEKPAVADSNSTEYAVVFTPTDTVNYSSAEGTAKLTVNKAKDAPNMPETTINTIFSNKTVGAVSLPDGWVWQDADKNAALEVNVATNATAVYIGTDAGNYENESVVIAITRSACNHSGGTATCKDKAVCENCGEAYGVLSTTHGTSEVRGAVGVSCSAEGYTGDTYCKVCDTRIAQGEVIPALGHKDENKDHVCDNGCDVVQGTCEDTDKNHKCDYGCDKVYGTHEAASGKDTCDYCGAVVSSEQEPEEDSEEGNDENANNEQAGSNAASTSPKTGDNNRVLPMGLAISVLLSICAGVLLMRRSSKNNM